MEELKSHNVLSIPNGWKELQYVAPLEFDISKLRPRPFLKSGELRIDNEEMCQRAMKFKGYISLADGKSMVHEQHSISSVFRDYYIRLPATLLRGPRGSFDIPCLGYRQGRWGLCFGRFGGIWRCGVRFACITERVWSRPKPVVIQSSGT